MAPRPSDPLPSRRPRRPIHMRGSTRPLIISRVTFIRLRFWIKGHHPFRKLSPEPGEQLPPAPNPNTNPTPSADTPNKEPSKAKKARKKLERWLHIVPRPPQSCEEEVALEDYMDPTYISGVVKSVDRWMDTVLEETPGLIWQLQNMYGTLPACQGDLGDTAQSQEQGEEHASQDQCQACGDSSEEEKAQDDEENYECGSGKASESDDGWADDWSDVPLLKRSLPSTAPGSAVLKNGPSSGIMIPTQENDLGSNEGYEKIIADDGASTRGMFLSDGSGSDKNSETIVKLNLNEKKDEAISEGKGKWKTKDEGEEKHIDQSHDDKKDEKEDESEENDTEKTDNDGNLTDNGSTHDPDDDDQQTGSSKGTKLESSADNSQQESTRYRQIPGADDSGNGFRGSDPSEHSQQEDTQDSS